MADLLQIADFVASTHDKWLAKSGGRWRSLLNRRSYVFASMLKNDAKNLQDGKKAVAHVMIKDTVDPTMWYLPYEVIERTQTECFEDIETEWRFLLSYWTLSEQEAEFNSGESQLIKLPQAKEEYATTMAANNLEACWNHPTGNFGDVRRPWGWRYWLTRDGLAVDGVGTVGSLSPVTYPLYRNQFFGPLGCSDGRRAITSANQLRKVMVRAFMATRFASVTGMDHASNEAVKEASKYQRIDCDPATWLFLEQQQYGRRDDMSKDQYAGNPTFMGLEIRADHAMGLDANGIPAAAAHGNIVAGAHANTGEMRFINWATFYPIQHKNYAPKREKPRIPDNQKISFCDQQWWLTTMCESRMHNAVIWGYGDLEIE